MIYRKLILISLLLFIDKKAQIVKGLTLILILVFSYYLQYTLKPYHSKDLNRMEILFIFTLFFTTFLGQYFLYSNLNSFSENIILVIIILINICFFTFWLYWMSFTSFIKLASLFSLFRRCLKRDSYDDEFYVEEVNLPGIVKSINLEKDTYTFIDKIPKEESTLSQ